MSDKNIAAELEAQITNALQTAMNQLASSMANAFNLADDILEPWRPFVDSMALAHCLPTAEEGEFCLADRRALAKIFSFPVAMDGAEMLLLDAVKKQVEQLRVFCLDMRDDIQLPLFPSELRRG